MQREFVNYHITILFGNIRSNTDKQTALFDLIEVYSCVHYCEGARMDIFINLCTNLIEVYNLCVFHNFLPFCNM